MEMLIQLLPEAVRPENQGGVLAEYLGNLFFICGRKINKN